MNEFPRQKLQEIVAQYGHSVYHDSKLCKALLRDFCGQYRKEISVLVGALEEGIPSQLLASKNIVPHTVLVAQLIKKLQGSLRLADDAATWAVESWVLALGISSSSSPLNPKLEPKPTIALHSQSGIDYTSLQDLLAAQKWKEADIETRKLMLKVTSRESQGFFDSASIHKLPCEDLQIIDQLWLRHSNGIFGFSVQKNLYQNLISTSKKDGKAWNELAIQVGWKKNDEWIGYDLLDFTSNLQGHLPALHPSERTFFADAIAGGGSVLWLVAVCIFLIANWTGATAEWWQWLWDSSYSGRIHEPSSWFEYLSAKYLSSLLVYWLFSLTQHVYLLFVLLKVFTSLIGSIVIFGLPIGLLLSPLFWLVSRHQKNVFNQLLDKFFQCNL
jgi:GUN4-like